MAKLRIGIDGACWANRRGYGRYTRSLLTALAARDDGDRYFLFVDGETANDPTIPNRFEKIVVASNQPPTEAASASSRRDVTDLLRMGWAVARRRLDVFFFPSVYTFFPLLRPLPTVVAIHDAIAENHPSLVFAQKRLAFFWRLKLRIALLQSCRVLTVSDHARDRIAEHFRLRLERIRVVLEAADPIFRPLANPRDPADLLPTCSLPRGARYLLYVGGLSPHKNLRALIEAYRRLVASSAFPRLRLLLVGDYVGDVFNSEYEGLQALVAQHGLGELVTFTGFIPDDVLVDLYNGAEVVVLPSLEEGFGLPAIEAAACAKPGVVSEVGPMGSLLGSAVWTFPPRDVDALTLALDTLLRDPVRRAAMGNEGRRRALAMTWERSAAQANDLLHEAATR